MKIDAVKMMRDARDRISRETWGMSSTELREYYREASRRYEALVAKEPPGREARLKAMGIFGAGDPSADEGESGVGESAMAGGGSAADARDTAPAETAVSAKPGSASD